MAIGGDGVLWLRLFPVLISFVAAFPFIKLCRELRIDLFAIIFALFLIATNGALIKYAQEVRMYSLLMCLSLFSMWLFVRLGNRGKGLIGLGIVNLLMVYTHYFGWLVIAAEIVAAGVLYRHLMRRMLVISVSTFVGFLSWLFAIVLASRQGSDVKQNIGWMSRPGIYEVFQFVLDTVEPFYQQSTSADAGAIYLVAIPILLLAIAGMIAGLFAGSRTDDKTVKVLAVLVIVPTVLAFLASWLSPLSIWGTRHLIIVFAPIAILIANCISRIARARTEARQARTHKLRADDLSSILNPRSAITAAMILLSAGAFVSVVLRATPQHSWCLVEDLSKEIAATGRPQKIYALDDLTAYHIWFATRNSENTTVELLKNISGTREDAAYFLPRGFNEIQISDGFGGLATENTEQGAFLFLRSSTLTDHRRDRADFVTSDSLPIQYLKSHGVAIRESNRITGATEDVYIFKLVGNMK